MPKTNKHDRRDISHNVLRGNLQYLAGLQNLVVLNISYNKFTGRVPDMLFFVNLPLSVLAGNPELCFSGNECSGRGKSEQWARVVRVAMVVLLCTMSVLLMAMLYMVVASKRRGGGDRHNDVELDGKDSNADMAPPWEKILPKLGLHIEGNAV
ncbi:Putative LRR receptor-like serine/threonine-protein kinase [Glycine soja]|uniref:Putative LRR receptor-like serine/threonine-protein kinase n=1 Tax=Glycine soja TaxID=3848 RepID=A0A0B2PXY7_GLYSO|nr:Putative LRR receptor-like serine/threonine-protein kinase [Glycine soja]